MPYVHKPREDHHRVGGSRRHENDPAPGGPATGNPVFERTTGNAERATTQQLREQLQDGVRALEEVSERDNEGRDSNNQLIGECRSLIEEVSRFEGADPDRYDDDTIGRWMVALRELNVEVRARAARIATNATATRTPRPQRHEPAATNPPASNPREAMSGKRASSGLGTPAHSPVGPASNHTATSAAETDAESHTEDPVSVALDDKKRNTPKPEEPIGGRAASNRTATSAAADTSGRNSERRKHASTLQSEASGLNRNGLKPWNGGPKWPVDPDVEAKMQEARDLARAETDKSAHQTPVSANNNTQPESTPYVDSMASYKELKLRANAEDLAKELREQLDDEARRILTPPGPIAAAFEATVSIQRQLALGEKTNHAKQVEDLLGSDGEDHERPLASARDAVAFQAADKLVSSDVIDEMHEALRNSPTEAVKKAILARAQGDLERQLFSSDAIKSIRTVVQTGDEEEVEKRIAADETIEQVASKPALTAFNALQEKVNAKIAEKLGAGGAGMNRSKEVRQFRGAVKMAARDAARQDLSAATEKVDGVGPATRRYVELQAGPVAHREAKASVDTVLAEKAMEGTEAVLAGVQESVADQARKAAWTVLRDNPAAIERAERAAKKAITSWEKTATAAAIQRGKDWAKAIVKPQTPQQQEAEEQTGALADAARQQVKRDRVGEKAVHMALEADTTSQALQLVGRALDTAIPNKGDQASLKLALKIPIPDTPGVFVTIGMEGKAARGYDGAMTAGVPIMGKNPNRLEVMSQFTVGGGIEAFGLGAEGKIGFFSRAGAGSTTTAMQALSYATYRAACNSHQDLGNFWAGKGASTDASATERAEDWAAMVEERTFNGGDENAYADLGISGSVGASLNAEIASASVQGGVGTFRRYDKQSLQDSLNKRKKNGRADELFANPVDNKGTKEAREKEAIRRRGKASGRTGLSYNLGANMEVKLLGQGVSFAGTLSGNAAGDWGVEITAGFSLPAGDAASALERIAVGMIGGAVSLGTSLGNAYKGQGSAGSATVDVGADIATIVNAGLENQVTNALAGLWSVDKSTSDYTVEDNADAMRGDTPEVQTDAGLVGNNGLTLALIFGRSGGQGIFRFEIRQSKGMTVKVGGGGVGLEVAVDKTKRLAAVGYEEEAWKAEMMGLQGTAQKGVIPGRGAANE